MVVKKDSILVFFEKHVIEKISLNFCRDMPIEFSNEYTISGSDEDKVIVFEFEEMSNITGQKILTRLIYDIEEYDDMHNKMIKKSIESKFVL